eukprot:Skav219494  [mRNA]  locus=scaffold937:64753:67576:- [translate_table: standard]
MLMGFSMVAIAQFFAQAEQLKRTRVARSCRGNAAFGLLGCARLAWLDSICREITTGIFEFFSRLSSCRRCPLLGCGVFTLRRSAHPSDALQWISPGQ